VPAFCKSCFTEEITCKSEKEEKMGVPGTYKLIMDSPTGVQTPTLKITGESGAYNGTLSGPDGIIQLQDLSVDGNSVTFKAEVSTPTGKEKLAFNCTVDGNTISGQVATPMGPKVFTGKRYFPQAQFFSSNVLK
jgi:hypothetical protein